MDIKEMRHEIEELMQLVESWDQNGEAMPIESEVALFKLSRLYESIKFNTNRVPLSTPVTVVSDPHEYSVLEQERVEEVAVDNLATKDDSIFAIDLDEVVLLASPVKEDTPEPE
ncbi:MAG: hypothetical protein SNF99_08900, partial [Rikenellaceae bacterium]